MKSTNQPTNVVLAIIMSSEPWIRTVILAGATVVTAALVSFVVVNQQRRKSDTYVGREREDCW